MKRASHATGSTSLLRPEELGQLGLSDSTVVGKAALFERAAKALAGMAGQRGSIHRWWVPGRLEFLGKHTDYCGGCSILATVDRGLCFCAVPRTDSQLRMIDAATGEVAELPVSLEATATDKNWTLYPAAVARRLAGMFPNPLQGADVAFISDLPPAAGLSSSSGLIVGFFLVLAKSNAGFGAAPHAAKLVDPMALGDFLGCVESGRAWRGLSADAGVGTHGGSQDQTAILCSVPGHLTGVDFFEGRLLPSVKAPDHLTFVIAISGVVAHKTGAANAAYNQVSQRAKICLELWSDISGQSGDCLEAMFRRGPMDFDAFRSALRADAQRQISGFSASDLLLRAEQFDAESHRLIPAARAAMAAGQWAALGDIVDESQHWAETALHNQTAQTRWLAGEARRLGAVAASAFGAGFGGAVWAMVETPTAENFLAAWRNSYVNEFPNLRSAASFFKTALGPPAMELAGLTL